MINRRLLLATTVFTLLGLVQPPGVEAQDVTGLFPTAAEISDGSSAQGSWYPFEVVGEGTQTIADVAAWLDGDDAAARLASWGWQGNAYRIYQTEAPDSPIEVMISIHAFTDVGLIELPNGSVLSGELVALDVFAERWATLRGVTAERAGIIGPGVSRQAGSLRIAGLNEATLFVASFSRVIRVTATGPSDPQWNGVEMVMDKVLERAERTFNIRTAVQAPVDYVFTPDEVERNDETLGNVADQFAHAIPIWGAGPDIPIAEYQMMTLSDGTILAGQCWDELGFLDEWGQFISCAFVGLPGSTGLASISPGVQLTTNAGEVLPASGPINEVVTTLSGLLRGYPLETSPFPAPIPMTEGAVAVLAWRVPAGFSGDVALLIPGNPGGAFWVPQMYRVPLGG